MKGFEELVAEGYPASITTYARKDGIATGELLTIIELGRELKANGAEWVLRQPAKPASLRN